MKLPPKETNEMKFVYLHDPNNPHHSVTSVGYVVTATEFQVQIARCHAPDRFTRKIARDIINGRYRKHGARKSYLKKDFPDMKDFYEALVFDWNPVDGWEILGSEAVFELED